MNIRQAAIEDAKKPIDYLSEFWADGCDTVFYKETLPGSEDEKEWLRNKDINSSVFYVVEENDKIVGSIDVKLQKQEH